MGLLDVAAADLVSIMSDVVGGFAVSVLITDPNNNQAQVSGLATDIGQNIDPETGMLVVGRRASVAFPISALRAAGFLTNPTHVADPKKRPWVLDFTLPTGGLQTFKVAKTMPDALGALVCLLEEYER